jgi:signal recognition particle receptor subunit beta
MSGKCKHGDCAAPGVPCHIGKDDHTTCEHWSANTAEVKTAKSVKPNGKSNINWSGSPFIVDEIQLVSKRNSPTIIGIIGKQDAGKTTFLAMVYTLMLNGKNLKDYDFAGTKTILGWDELHHKLRVLKGEVSFPAPTSVNSNRQYHLSLRNKQDRLKDVLFSDASGEVFTLWANDRNDPIAENARWIYDNANGFMLFIDCAALIEQKNLAKREIINIAQQLTHDLKGRPVLAVWSKSDRKNEVHPTIKDSLSSELKALFSNYDDIEVSNYLDPGPDELVHKNNLEAIDWILNSTSQPYGEVLKAKQVLTNDVFLNYRGHE